MVSHSDLFLFQCHEWITLARPWFLIFFFYFNANWMKLSLCNFSILALGQEYKCFLHWSKNKRSLLKRVYPSFIIVVGFCCFTIVIRNGKIVWKHKPYRWCFPLNLKCPEWLYRLYIKTVKNGNFCEKLLSENDIEAVLATFCCYNHGAKVSEAV